MVHQNYRQLRDQNTTNEPVSIFKVVDWSVLLIYIFS